LPYNGVVFKPPPNTAMLLKKRTPIIIYKFVLFTTLKEQLTFRTQLYNRANAALFKAVGLEELVRQHLRF